MEFCVLKNHHKRNFERQKHPSEMVDMISLVQQKKKVFDKLKKEQLTLQKKIILKDSIKKIKTIAGCDQSFVKNKIISAIVVLNYKNLEIIEKKNTISKVSFPYIPGYLSYRELPAIIKTYKKLKIKPDVLLCDFNGILHPRGLGAASHLGVLLNICTIGVAKNLLCGTIKNKFVFVNDEKKGYALKNKNYKVIYISPGNKITLKTSIKIVKYCIKNKLPEPIKLAHYYANTLK